MLIQKLRIVIAALVGAAALLLLMRFVPADHDYTEEATVGVITEYGMPIPFAFSAPGYTRAKFSVAAALADYLIFAALIVFVLNLMRRPSRSSD